MSPATPSSPGETVMLWGAPASGKSGFVGSLYALYGQQDMVSPRWTAHPKDALNTHTEQELDRAYQDLRNHGFYRKTNLRELEPLHLIIRKRAGERDIDAVKLLLVDPAGEIITEQSARESSLGLSVHKQAAQSRGLIWLINVGDSANGPSQAQIAILPELVELLEASGGQQIDIPVAICLSMIDKLPAADAQIAIADPRAVLRSQIGDSVPRWFEAVCPNHRYFAISSTGARKGEVEPINISAVLDWIVQQGRHMKRPPSSAVVVAAPVGQAARVTPSSNTTALARPATFNFTLARSLAAIVALGAVGWGGVTGLKAYSATPPATANQSSVMSPMPVGKSTPGTGSRQAKLSQKEAQTPSKTANTPPVKSPKESLTSSSSEGVLVSTKVEQAEEIRRRATRIIDSAAPGARAVVPMRFQRAHACVTAALRCDSRQIIQDYTWVRAYGNLRQRAEAKKTLDSIFRSTGQGAQ